MLTTTRGHQSRASAYSLLATSCLPLLFLCLLRSPIVSAKSIRSKFALANKNNLVSRRVQDTTTLSTFFFGGSAQSGVMFDLLSLSSSDITITGIDIHTASQIPENIEVWTKPGTWQGYDEQPVHWYMRACSMIIGVGINLPTQVPYDQMDWIHVKAGETVAFYTTLVYPGGYLQYTAFPQTKTGDVLVENTDLQLLIGCAKTYAFGAGTFYDRSWNGNIHYLMGYQERAEPVSVSDCRPSMVPSTVPSVSPTLSLRPSDSPTRVSSVLPSMLPTRFPTIKPSPLPSARPSARPSSRPSANPSVKPSASPTYLPSASPMVKPSSVPTIARSWRPTPLPTEIPSMTPSAHPTQKPSTFPTNIPTSLPTLLPSSLPTFLPSRLPSVMPSMKPSLSPTRGPSIYYEIPPSHYPTVLPSLSPTSKPSGTPSITPSATPSSTPSSFPTVTPSITPSALPSEAQTENESIPNIASVAAVAAAAGAAASAGAGSASAAGGGVPMDVSSGLGGEGGGEMMVRGGEGEDFDMGMDDDDDGGDDDVEVEAEEDDDKKKKRGNNNRKNTSNIAYAATAAAAAAGTGAAAFVVDKQNRNRARNTDGTFTNDGDSLDNELSPTLSKQEMIRNRIMYGKSLDEEDNMFYEDTDNGSTVSNLSEPQFQAHHHMQEHQEFLHKQESMSNSTASNVSGTDQLRSVTPFEEHHHFLQHQLMRQQESPLANVLYEEAHPQLTGTVTTPHLPTSLQPVETNEVTSPVTSAYPYMVEEDYEHTEEYPMIVERDNAAMNPLSNSGDVFEPNTMRNMNMGSERETNVSMPYPQQMEPTDPYHVPLHHYPHQLHYNNTVSAPSGASRRHNKSTSKISRRKFDAQRQKMHNAFQNLTSRSQTYNSSYGGPRYPQYGEQQYPQYEQPIGAVPGYIIDGAFVPAVGQPQNPYSDPYAQQYQTYPSGSYNLEGQRHINRQNFDASATPRRGRGGISRQDMYATSSARGSSLRSLFSNGSSEQTSRYKGDEKSGYSISG